MKNFKGFKHAKRESAPTPTLPHGGGKNCLMSKANLAIREGAKAFTLAEVLITLGVIGVVSAITMPVIHSKIQDYILKNRFKKVYNTYSSAIQMMNIENGDVYSCYYDNDNLTSDWSGCHNFYTELAKKLKYVKYCQNNALSNGCIPEYPKYNSEDDNANCPGFKKTVVNSRSRAWVLNDGSIMFTYDNGYAPVFAVDINGLSKPNKGGYDLFSFSIDKKGNTTILSDRCHWEFMVDGGKTVQEMLLN